MLQKAYRLPARTKLLTPFFYKSNIFSLRMAKNGLLVSRFGFVIAKKTARTAVARNVSKRKFRACIEQRREQLQPGYDYLFILQKDLSETESSSICQEVENLLQTKGLIIQ